MRVVTWNCNGALRRKLSALLELRADIYVVQECEDPRQATDAYYRKWAQGSLWVGASKNKGIGVFSESVELRALDWAGDGLELFLPFLAGDCLTGLAVWTRHANSPNFRYIGQAWKYLQAHSAKIPNKRAVVLGDFNSNSRWDQWYRWWNHSDVVRDLSDAGLGSIYHAQSGEPQGKETQPTFFMYRKAEKPFHIDYVFASKDILSSARMRIGEPSRWLGLSDHMPIIIDFELDGPAALVRQPPDVDSG